VLAAQLNVRAALTGTPLVDVNVESAVTLICFTPSEGAFLRRSYRSTTPVAQER